MASFIRRDNLSDDIPRGAASDPLLSLGARSRGQSGLMVKLLLALLAIVLMTAMTLLTLFAMQLGSERYAATHPRPAATPHQGVWPH